MWLIDYAVRVEKTGYRADSKRGADVFLRIFSVSSDFCGYFRSSDSKRVHAPNGDQEASALGVEK